MRVHLLHGFNVRDAGKASTDRLKPYLYAVGYEVFDHDYGWLGLLGVRLHDNRIATRVARAVKLGDIGIGHSNGCTILLSAAAQGAPFRGLVFINPALDNDAALPAQPSFFHVYHNAGDDAVLAARFLLFHPWGDMGRRGYLGPDPRVRNFPCPDLNGHSALFAKVAEYGPRIIDNMERA